MPDGLNRRFSPCESALSLLRITRNAASALLQNMLGKAHFLGTPGSNPAPEATLERDAPRGMHQNCCSDALGSPRVAPWIIISATAVLPHAPAGMTVALSYDASSMLVL